jgi:hypothetical protein
MSSMEDQGISVPGLMITINEKKNYLSSKLISQFQIVFNVNPATEVVAYGLYDGVSKSFRTESITK